eukprot:CAMPEP_0198726288 /NCGR_PEP_ID=MMETSP1475-20131203/3390_1 /TAXON_ID= ORGANISM="Unidentified sp., Strain CCMP1999" /NCGR_SAMPLE_ID=MMETSP1475 /ASSEMBLY_ACC=CAM_ASM_001111 /LENGTH=308 /DNA_ID=CAMNT_0044488195 /DNA_START=148 /DNA_END=1074 /DNA_ORIENTATION=-
MSRAHTATKTATLILSLNSIACWKASYVSHWVSERHMMELVSDEGEKVSTSLADKWMLYPSVSVGNVPQLATELMLSTFGTANLVAHVRDPTMIPVSGDGSPYSELSTGCELYSLDGAGNAFLPRAPPCPGRAAETAKLLVHLVREKGVKDLVVLTSAYAGGRRDVQLQDTSKFRFMVTSKAEKWAQSLRQADILPVDGAGELGWSSEISDYTDEVGEGRTPAPAFVPSLRKASFVRTLLEACEEASISLCVILMFVFEGDNTADAAEMAALYARVCGLTGPDQAPPKWKIPPSWAGNLGPRPEPMIY